MPRSLRHPCAAGYYPGRFPKTKNELAITFFFTLRNGFGITVFKRAGKPETKTKEKKITITITITGYEQEGYCEHCGRALKHCIKIDDGRIVGATCFDKIITKPKTYNGKPYRVGTENVIRYAKIAESGKLTRHGISAHQLTFEAA